MDSQLGGLLHDSGNRFILFPIRYPALWQMYKDSRKSFWTPEEIDLSKDVADWSTYLNDDERRLFSTILSFLASSDGIVGESLVAQFSSEVHAPEAKCFYGFQMMMENIHADTYTRLLHGLVVDETDIRRLFDAVIPISLIHAKAEWYCKWFDEDLFSFGTRLIAFAVVQAVFFSSSFAAIFWVKCRGILHGLCRSTELILRDGGRHVAFACEMYRCLGETVPSDVVHGMVHDAVQVEKSFFELALPRAFRGLNVALMNQYVEYVADCLLRRLGFRALYGTSNPFPFMEPSAISGRASFFDRRVSEYDGSPHRDIVG